MNLFDLEGKVAIITGATGLIGKNHCKALSGAGANIVAVDIDEIKLEELCNSLQTKSISCAADITNKTSVAKILSSTIETFGQVDILVNNAAVNDMVENRNNTAEDSKFENYPIELFRRVMDVNVTGMFLCSQVIGTHMAERGKGSIINIASTYGIVAPDQSLYVDDSGRQYMYKSPVYPTSKGAVLSFTRFLAAYWGKAGVRVNALSPGGVENNQASHFIEKYSNRTPLGRMARPDDYMGGLLFLASDASSYMTGANLVIDGGWTIW
jgi:NAD(P)-dependent dehydrogenase (short-subunit alcohol dehydrogenase family)